MSALVPFNPSPANETKVRGGSPISSATFQDAALTLNWAMGHGAELVPFYTPKVNISAGSSLSFAYRVEPRYQQVQRAWVISVKSQTNSLAEFDFTPSVSGVTTTHYGAFRPEDLATIVVTESVASQSSSEVEIGFTIDATDAITVMSVGCWEVPRYALGTSASDGGVDIDSLLPREPIYDTTGKSYGGVLESVVTARTAARRNGILQLSWGSSTTAGHSISTTSSLYDNPLRGAISQLARLLYRTASAGTTRNHYWRVLARSASAGAGSADCRLSMTNGATSTITFTPTTTWTWYPTTAGSANTIAVNVEDLDEADGRRGAAWDDSTFEFQIASGTLHVATISVWESTANS